MANIMNPKQWPMSLFYLQLIISAFETDLGTAFLKNLDDLEPKGPRFREEPPAKVEFSNSSGAEIRCSAEGSTPLRVFWQTRDGTEASDVAGLRYQRGDATLVFPPFERSEYRQDVHDSVYQCVAVNDVGKVLSRETHVRGVIQQKFSPQVYDDFVIRGNTAVLRCHLPAFVREYVTMDAWIRNEEDAVLRETDAADEKYSVLPSGELLLYQAEDIDSRGNYRCRARHRLTGELVTSVTSGKIVVTEPHSPMAPKIIFSQSQVRAEEGNHVRVPCVSQAQPPPSYRWMKETIAGTMPVLEDGRVRVLPGGTLHIRSVRLSDGGKYQCLVKNSMGEKRTDTLLLITAPLKVKVIPAEQTLNIGEAAVLNCSVSGHPVHTVIWKKDGRPLNSNARVQLMSRDVVHVTSVRREDKGMYQCFAWNDGDGAQATAELRIGDVPPYLLSAFPDVAVYPGEFVSLKCVSSGNSVPRVTWTIDGSPIGVYQGTQRRVQLSDVVSAQGHVSSYLNISDARTDDSGEYRCDVTNDVGTAWHASRLNVYGPLFVRPFRNFSAVSGHELMLKCPVGGYPIQSIAWQKGGINLPLDHRQKVSSSGVLTIQNVQRAADQGEYTCIARGPDGQGASGSTFLSLVVAPIIDAQVFPETITANEGSRTKILCSVPIGDPPIALRWLKNNNPFTGSGKITIQRLEDSSIMLFRKIKSSDRGKYTCIASNSAASSNLTTNLIVNVPPSWISEPSNTSVILSHSVWLNCSADGYPIPSIVWRKAREANPADFGYVHSSSRIRQYNNGTLVLWDADITDRGFYLCQANNGIGAALSKVIFLNIQVPPKFEESYQSRAVRERENASLKCTAVGNTPITIVWKKNKIPLLINPNSRFSLKETTEEGRMTSELMISSTTRQENGLYSCSATNAFGSDESTFQLIVQGVPDPPVNLTVSNVSSRTISVTWEVPYNGNSHITGSSVQYKLASDSWKGHTSQLIVSGSETVATLRELLPVSTYQVRIITENAIGKSTPSDILNVTTEVEAPSGPPRELSVHPTGDQSLKVMWKPPREETRNGPIQGYHVGYRIHQSMDKYQFKRVDGLKDRELQHSTYVTGLQPFTSYEIVVKAFNTAGSGPKSDSVVGTTLETAPPTSPLLQVTSTYPDSVDIRWEKDSKDKSSITEYTLHFKPDDGAWQTKKLSSTSDRYSLHGLKCGTRYHMYLTASNSLGTGEPSLSVNVRTKGAAPMPASQQSFVSANATWVMLHLSGWQSAGCPIRHFKAQYRHRYQGQWKPVPDRIPSDRETYIVGPLLPDREYELMVTAHSEAGVTQADYKFRTIPIPSIVTTPVPISIHREYEIPFHRNVNIVIPVVFSSLVLIIVLFTVALCLRRHSTTAQDRRIAQQGTDSDSQKAVTDSLLMSEISQQQKICGKQIPTAANGSHYSSPTRRQEQPITPKGTEHRRTDKQHEYAEPYIAFPSSRQRLEEGGFATIKRAPPRSGSVTSAYKPGFS